MRVRAISLCLLLATLACGSAKIDPPDLVGVWRTQARAYRDRKLEVQPDWIVFGTGGAGSESFARDGVEVEPAPKGSGLLCTLYYRDHEGARTYVRVVFQTGSPDKLRFENRDEWWFREADAHWLRKGG